MHCWRMLHKNNKISFMGCVVEPLGHVRYDRGNHRLICIIYIRIIHVYTSIPPYLPTHLGEWCLLAAVSRTGRKSLTYSVREWNSLHSETMTVKTTLPNLDNTISTALLILLCIIAMYIIPLHNVLCVCVHV